ncbi:MAG: hypothetical protein KC619_00195, partial [Myxococcales bacterium]|nr:hypothetical protein [Myxococcales bacterium]
MTVSRLLVGSLLLASACASPAARPPRTAAPPPDDALELAALLPERADRCVVVRPRRVPARRRELLIRQSWADRSVWDLDLDVAAYTRAEALDAEGRRALRSYFRFAGTPAQIRERASRFPFRWEDQPCEGIACGGPSARWLDERTVMVSHHAWPTPAHGVSTADCLRLARRRTDAVEVAMRAGMPGSFGLAATRHHRVIVGGRRQISITLAIDFDHEADAVRALEDIPRVRASVLDSLAPLEASRREMDRDGSTVWVRDTYSWADLELARADVRLDAEAAADRARRATPIPIERVDVRRLAVVHHQVRLRAGELQWVRGPARAELVRQLATLLERAVAAHPAELGWAEQLVRLRLSDLDDAAGARALCERVLGGGVAPDPEPWRILRREAAALQGPGALAARLVEDRVVEAGDAHRVAEDLVRLREDGVAYEWAEGALRLGRELTGAAGLTP